MPGDCWRAGWACWWTDFPWAICCPARRRIFWTPEDRGGNYVVASAVKALRVVSLIVALLLPGMLAAVCLYHQEMIPTTLLEAIVESRQAVPFSTGVEVRCICCL